MTDAQHGFDEYEDLPHPPAPPVPPKKPKADNIVHELLGSDPHDDDEAPLTKKVQEPGLHFDEYSADLTPPPPPPKTPASGPPVPPKPSGESDTFVVDSLPNPFLDDAPPAEQYYGRYSDSIDQALEVFAHPPPPQPPQKSPSLVDGPVPEVAETAHLEPEVTHTHAPEPVEEPSVVEETDPVQEDTEPAAVHVSEPVNEPVPVAEPAPVETPPVDPAETATPAPQHEHVEPPAPKSKPLAPKPAPPQVTYDLKNTADAIEWVRRGAKSSAWAAFSIASDNLKNLAVIEAREGLDGMESVATKDQVMIFVVRVFLDEDKGTMSVEAIGRVKLVLVIWLPDGAPARQRQQVQARLDLIKEVTGQCHLDVATPDWENLRAATLMSKAKIASGAFYDSGAKSKAPMQQSKLVQETPKPATPTKPVVTPTPVTPLVQQKPVASLGQKTEPVITAVKEIKPAPATIEATAPAATLNQESKAKAIGGRKLIGKTGRKQLADDDED